MYTKEQKERALKEFERLGSVQAVVTLLGYPSRHTLYDGTEIRLPILPIIMVRLIRNIKLNKNISMHLIILVILAQI